MVGEGTLNTDTVKDMPHCEAGPGPAAPDTDYDAVEHLRSYSLALNNSEADLDGVSRPKLSNIRIGLDIYY